MQLIDQCREEIEATFGHIQVEMGRVTVQVAQTLGEMKSVLGYQIAQATMKPLLILILEVTSLVATWLIWFGLTDANQVLNPDLPSHIN